MSMIGFIFARGGSKGIPGKNILSFCGKPLIAWSIEHALSVSAIDRLIVSTDSEEIANLAEKFGAEVPFIRPPELATDTSSELDSWKHALNFLAVQEGSLPDAMVSIPPTAPLRSVKDIERCITEYESGNTDVVITVSHARRNPYFNMVQRTASGRYEVVCASNREIHRRQDAPEIFDVATVAYVANSSFVLGTESLFAGNLSAVIVSQENSMDIDTPLDFKMAELLMQERIINNG